MHINLVKLFFYLYLAWNLITFGVMGFDKGRAKTGGWRVAEKTLLAQAFCFGGVGVYMGMRVFRHKTKHPKFTWGVPLSIVFNLAVITGVRLIFF